MWLSLLYFTQGIGATFGIFGGMPLAPLKSAYAQLTCTSSLQHWLWHNGLLINPHKSVAALFRTRQRLARPGWPTHVAVAGSDIIKMSDHLKVLGVTLDSSMTLDTQVTATVRACNFHLQSLRQLRSSLPREFCTERRLCNHRIAAGLLQLSVLRHVKQQFSKVTESAECCRKNCLPSTTPTSLSRPS